MGQVDFSDEEAAEAWFDSQSVQTRCAVASRAALRVFANFRAGMTGSAGDLDMNVLRAILTSAGRGMGRHADVNWDAAASAANVAATLPRFSGSAYLAAESAKFAVSAVRSHTSSFSATAVLSAADSVDAALYAADPANPWDRTADAATSWDAEHLDNLFGNPVWAGAKMPDETSENHTAVVKAMKADTAWNFWVRFYEGMWEGTFEDWDLAFEVIKIDEADWEKGYVHIGGVIAGLAQALAKDAIDELRLQPHDRFGIGGNNPPPDEKLDLATLQIQQGATLISTQLDAKAPDKSLLQRGIELMGKGLLAFIKWLGRKGDFTVDQLIKWGVPTGCAYALANPSKVQAAIDAAKSWLALL